MSLLSVQDLETEAADQDTQELMCPDTSDEKLRLYDIREITALIHAKANLKFADMLSSNLNNYRKNTRL